MKIFIQKYELGRLLNALSRGWEKGRFCTVYSQPHGDRTEFRKDVSTPVGPIIL